MGELQTKKPFVNLDIPSGQYKDSEAYNLKEIRPVGNFGFQYTKDTGGGLLKITLLVSVNGVDFEESSSIAPVIEESSDLASGYGAPRPPIASYIKFRAYAVGGAISVLNGWVVIQ